MARKTLERYQVWQHKKGLKLIAETHRILNRIVSVGGISRALIIRSANNGGIPKPGCTIHVKILEQNYHSLMDDITGMWDEQDADAHYCQLLDEIASKDHVSIVTKELPEDSKLKHLYDATHVTHSDVYRLTMTGREMIYLSINWFNNEGMSPTQQAIITQCVQDLKAIYSHY